MASAYERCRASLNAAYGDEMSERQMKDLFTEIERRARRIQSLPDFDPSENAILRAADELGQDLKLSQIIERRNATMNAQTRLQNEDYLNTTWADKRAEGIKAMLVGSYGSRLGSRDSVDANQRALAGRYLEGMTNDVRKLGDVHQALIASGEIDRELARALGAIDTPDGYKGMKEIGEIATVIRKWQEIARNDANNAGAWINKLPGYITAQTHDADRIRRAGFDAWRADVEKQLDIPRTMENVDEDSLDAFLRATYNGLASGKHLKLDMPSEKSGGFKGPSNLAKRISRERVLHFKSADDWFDYNEKYGTGSVRESIIRRLERSAFSTALMRRLGTNPGDAIERLKKSSLLALKDNPEATAKFASEEKSIADALAVVDGSMNVPANQFWARLGANMRAWQSMAKLGGSVISSVTDVAAKASELRYQGAGTLSGMADGIESLVRGRGSDEQKEILSQLGVFFDNVRGEVIRRFSADDSLGGTMARMQGRFFKWNGLSWWTDAQKAGIALMMSHRLALNSGKAWGELGDDLTRVMGLYGLDEGKWDILRAGKKAVADEREYLTTDALRELPDESFHKYLKDRGIEPTPKRVAELREEIASQYSTYITDRADFAVPTPDGRTRAFMLRGTKPGSLEGELLRFLFQFKAFPIAFTQKALRREIFGRGGPDDSLVKALMSGHGEAQGLAQLILWMTLFGYGAMTAKDMLKNKSPRDPLSKDTVIAAMAQGGGLGLYGDALFGMSNKYGGAGAVENAAGPTLSAAGEGIDLWRQFRASEDGSDVQRAAAQGIRTAINNTPFLNLFYTRAVLDALILNRVQESLSPGHTRRMEQRMKEQNGQQFLVRPSGAGR